MKKSIKIFMMLTLLFGSTWVGAEELSVKVSGQRDAVLNVVDKNAGDPEVSGTVKGSANLKEGKSGMRADLVLKEANELQGAQADALLTMTANTIEAMAYLDMKLPPDPTAPKVLDVDMATVTEGDQSAANFEINFEGPMGTDPIPKGTGKLDFKGGFKAFTSNANFDFSGEALKGAAIPFSKFSLDITETVDAESKLNKTTIAFSVTAPKGGPTAQQLASLPMFGPMLEGQLKQVNVKYENLDFPAPTDEGENTTGKGTVTLIDVRGTLKPYLGMMAAQMQGIPDATKALEEIIEARMDKFHFEMEAQETAIKGSVAVEAANLEQFWNGYLTLLPAMNEASNKEMLANAGEFRNILEPLMRMNTEQAAESLKILVASDMKIDGEMSFSLDPKESDTKDDAANAQKMMAFKTSGKILSSGYAGFIEKAKAAGLPVAEKAVGKLTLNLKDQTALTGDAYFYTDGQIVEFYKNMLAKAAKEGQAPEDVQAAIANLKLNDVGVKMTLQDNKMVVMSRSDTSDLTAVAALILKQAAPQFAGDLTGGSVDVAMGEDGKGTSDVKFFFSNFLPGKDAAGIKEVLGLPSSAKVTLDAPADQVALVPVVQPELGIDGKLAQVQEAGQAMLGVSASEIASGGAAGGGSKNWGLIAVGLLLLAGVGGFLAFGKKS